MKKILILLMFSAMFFVTAASADFTPGVEKILIAENAVAPSSNKVLAADQEKSDFPTFVCVDSVTYSLLPKDLKTMIYSENSALTMIVIPETEQVDKKNKTITVWVNVIVTFDGVKSITSDYNEYGKELYKNYGYQKILVKLDTKTKKFKVITKTDYTCSGNVIKTYGDSDWGYIVPGSMTEEIYIQLKKKYKL